MQRAQIFDTFASVFPGKYESPKITFGASILPRFNYEVLWFQIDTSASTNNVGGRGRGRGSSRGSSDDEDDDDAPVSSAANHHVKKTKIIALAELEGIANFIAHIASEYDMSGITIRISSFGGDTYHSKFGDYVVKNNASLQEFLDTLDRNIFYDSGDTALLPALQEVYDRTTADGRSTCLVIASDGQPNSHGSVSDVLSVSKEYLRNPKCPIKTVFTIGAGSIEEGSSACRGGKRFETCFRDRDGTSEQYRSASNSGGECNNAFLIDLASLAQNGAYFPACTDYSELHTALDEFFAYINRKQMRTVLDKRMRPVDLATMPQYVTDYFFGQDAQKDPTLGVIVKMPHGWYAISNDRQIAIEAIDGCATDFIANVVLPDVMIRTYDNVVNTQPGRQNVIITAKTAEPDTKTFMFCALLDAKGRFRMRRVIYI